MQANQQERFMKEEERVYHLTVLKQQAYEIAMEKINYKVSKLFIVLVFIFNGRRTSIIRRASHPYHSSLSFTLIFTPSPHNHLQPPSSINPSLPLFLLPLTHSLHSSGRSKSRQICRASMMDSGSRVVNQQYRQKRNR